MHRVVSETRVHESWTSVVGLSQGLRFLVLTTRSAAPGDKLRAHQDHMSFFMSTADQVLVLQNSNQNCGLSWVSLLRLRQPGPGGP